VNVALETSALGKRYGKRWALRDCSFELPAGTIAGLVGPNGAGKTTLLHIAVGLLAPTTGSVHVLDSSPASDHTILSRVGFVAQDTPLYANFSVDDLLRFGEHTNEGFDIDFARQRIERLDIPLDQRAGSLSGGQRAQVALALALAKRPEILLLDEPLASLDPLARRDFLRTLMEGVVEGGITVVLSSHLLADLERVCDHIMILAGGRVRLVGDTTDLVRTHKVLIGPSGRPHTITGVANVLHESVTNRQATLLVQTDGPIIDPAWTVQETSLEDIVLAYLEPELAPAGLTELHPVPTQEVAR